MAMRAGWEFQVTITPSSATFNLVCKTYRSERSAPTLDGSNSEGRPGNINAPTQNARGYAARVKNLRSARLVLGGATIDDFENPFIGTGNSPLNWKEGDYVTNFAIHPAGVGVGNPNAVERYDSLQIIKITRSGEVGGLQPFDIEFESDGKYS